MPLKYFIKDHWTLSRIDSTIILTKMKLKNWGLMMLYLHSPGVKKKASGRSGPCRAKVMSQWRHEGAEVLREDESWWERGKQTTNTPRRRLEESRGRRAMARHQRKDPWPPAAEAALVVSCLPLGLLRPPFQLLDSSSHFLTTSPPSIPHPIPSTQLAGVSALVCRKMNVTHL